MKRAIPIVAIIACIIGGLILTRNKPNVIPVPDEIIVHNGDGTLILEKTDAAEQIKIFNKFTKLINGRVTKNISTAQDIINNSVVDNLKNNPLWIEFRYKDKQKMDVAGDGFTPFEYTNLLFVLESKDGKTDASSVINTMQYGEKNEYMDSSRGPLKYSEVLVDYVKGFNSIMKIAEKR